MKKIINSNNAPTAIGPYSQAVEANGVVFVSGQLGLNPVTGELAIGLEEQAKTALNNINSILNEAGLDMKDIVKTTVFIKDMADFAVVNNIYAGFFASDFPARACVEVSALPKGALVEIECVAARL